MAYLGTVRSYISGTGKATDFKSNMAGRNSQGPSEQKPIKILEKRERRRIYAYVDRRRYAYLRIYADRRRYVDLGTGVPKFLGTPVLSQEWVKLRTSNFMRTLIGSIATKAH